MYWVPYILPTNIWPTRSSSTSSSEIWKHRKLIELLYNPHVSVLTSTHQLETRSVLCISLNVSLISMFLDTLNVQIMLYR